MLLTVHHDDSHFITFIVIAGHRWSRSRRSTTVFFVSHRHRRMSLFSYDRKLQSSCVYKKTNENDGCLIFSNRRVFFPPLCPSRFISRQRFDRETTNALYRCSILSDMNLFFADSLVSLRVEIRH